jgi:hypothetical protein
MSNLEEIEAIKQLKYRYLRALAARPELGACDLLPGRPRLLP